MRTVAEKYRDWTDETPAIDEILAICTMWWLRDSFPSSIYAYHGERRTLSLNFELTTERANSRSVFASEFVVAGVSNVHNDLAHYLKKPFGYSAFEREISCTPEAWVGATGNIQFYRYQPKVCMTLLVHPSFSSDASNSGSHGVGSLSGRTLCEHGATARIRSRYARLFRQDLASLKERPRLCESM